MSVQTQSLRIAWSFFRTHFKASMAIFGGIVLVVLRARKHDTLSAHVATEMQSTAAARQIQRIAIDQGIEAAHLKVEQDYAHQVTQLDARQQAQAEKLKADPAALAAFVVKAAKR